MSEAPGNDRGRVVAQLARRFGVVAVVGAIVLWRWHSALPSGALERTLTFAGKARTYVLYAPKTLPAHPALVLALHGHGGSGRDLSQRTGRAFDAIAETQGAVVVYPNALRGQWSAGHHGETSEDDVGFLAALVASLSKELGVDPKRVFATGFSNGAAMVYRLACERPELVAAIAPVSGALSQTIPTCSAARRVPLLSMHGTADTTVPYDSGERAQNVADWVRRNGCAKQPVVTRAPDVDPSDGATARIERYTGCADGADVVHYAIEGGGHTWPGTGPQRPSAGNACRDFEAGVVIWEFFAAHPMR